MCGRIVKFAALSEGPVKSNNLPLARAVEGVPMGVALSKTLGPTRGG